MKRDWELTQEAFDTLLDWLDPDREQAGRKYEAIRLRLIKIFTCRACPEAEFQADETINRVSAKVDEISRTYVGDPALYFYAVAQKVYLEYRRAPAPVEFSVAMLDTRAVTLVQDFEPVYRCLERCLESLPPESRELVALYYQQEKQAKIDQRKLLATELGIGLNALRIRAHRIRLALRQCVRDCLDHEPGN